MKNFQILSLDKLFESPLNPRQTYNEKKMAELVESIRAKGILTPLIVRPNNGKFEIGAGHRRYRAALQAGLKEAPANIREMSDTDFLELLTIENLQREDLQPLDEAQGYQALMEKSKYDVPAIAGKVGKSESYVYQRLKLLELIPEAQKQLLEEKITAGHAILLARLQPEEQKECLEEIKSEEGYGNGMSVRDLADHIDRQIHLDLNSASFKKTDPDLVPGAGPCTICRKRTGFMPTLFPDIKKKDTCTDPNCFHAKVKAFTDRWLEEKVEDSDEPPLRLSWDSNYQMKKIPEDPLKPIPSNFWREIANKQKDSCPSAREGIVTEGRNAGQVKLVCADPNCNKHHGRYEGSADSQKWKAEQKAAEQKRKQEETFRLRIIDAILPTAGDLSKSDLAFLAMELFDELWNEHRKILMSRHEIKPVKIQYGFDQMKPMKKHIESCSTVDLGRLLIEMGLIRHRDRGFRSDGKTDPLLEIAKRYTVDVKKIEAELKAEEKEKAAAKKKKAEKKGKKPIKVKGPDRPKYNPDKILADQAKKPKSGVCRVCGCTHETPCINPVTDEPCSWTDKTKTLCTSCQRMEKTEEAQRKVQTSAKKKARTGPCGATLDKNGICDHLQGNDCDMKCCRLCENDTCNIRCVDAPKPKPKKKK